ncbi:MAG: stress response translation initiation inhibitor YciH [Candidatus Micrarchaeota archaeon]|nr:stress response translation initiation inhibitor YciH [Candidatus Micrarchaeota archaeon]
MAGICPKCGLPLDICVCDTLEKETPHQIKIYVDKKRFGKLVTIVEGLDPKEIDKIAKDLKHMLSTGGTSKNGIILLQGDHKDHVKQALLKIGFKEEHISMR